MSGPGTEGRSPYRGPEPFRFVDHPLFRARDEEIRVLLQTLTIFRGLVVYGEQGAGKSSLVNAALLPALLGRDLAVERVLVRPELGGELLVDRMPIAETGPPYLDSELVPPEEPAQRVPFSIEEFEARVRNRGGDSPTPPRTLVLLLDQFEEIVTTFDPTVHGRSRRALVELFLRLFFDRSLRIKLVLIFREDYLAKIAELMADAPDWISQHYWLRPPAKQAAMEIIESPFDARRVQPHFDRGQFSPELVSALVSEIQAQPSDRLNLTDVQIAALELWKADDAARLLGEVHLQGLIQRYFERRLEQLTKVRLRDPAVALLTFMVTPFGTRNVISEEDLISRVQASEPVPTERLKLALAALERTRLVRRNVEHDAAYYDIVSESLAPWVAQQRRARDAELAARRARHELRGARIGLGVVTVLVAALLLALLAYTIAQRRQDAARIELEAMRAELLELRTALASTEVQRTRATELAGAIAEQANQRQPQRGTAMLGSSILEVAIGLALLYSLLSLLCTVLHELYAAFTDLRARHLADGVQRLLDDPTLVDQFYLHPLIRSLAAQGRRPSYIPSDAFAYALLDVVAPGIPHEPGSIRDAILQLKNKSLSRVLFLHQSRSRSPEDFARNVAAWFDSAMDGVSSSYRRQTQMQLLILALMATVALNVDTLNVVNRLSRDPILRASLVAQAEARLLAPPPSQSPASGIPGTGARDADAQGRLAEAYAATADLDIPVGWTRKPTSPIEILRSLPGWLITMLVVSLGAPFWFDLLNRFMVVRWSVKPREKSREEKSKD